MNDLRERLPDDAQHDAIVAESLLRILREHTPPAYLRPVAERLEQYDREVIRTCREAA